MKVKLQDKSRWDLAAFIELTANVRNADAKELMYSTVRGTRIRRYKVKPFALTLGGKSDSESERLRVASNVWWVLKDLDSGMEMKTVLGKIVWFRVWFYLVISGIVGFDGFKNSYQSWRQSKGAGYSGVIVENAAGEEVSCPLDIYVMSGLPSAKELRRKIDFDRSLGENPLKPFGKSRSLYEAIGARNMAKLKAVLESAIAEGGLDGLGGKDEIDGRYRYRGSRADLFRELSKRPDFHFTLSVFEKGISHFVKPKAAV